MKRDTKDNRMLKRIVGVVLLLILLAGILSCFLMFRKDITNQLLYATEDKLYVTDGKEKTELSRDLSSGIVGKEAFDEMVVMYRGEKFVIYPDKYDEDGTYSLYKKSLEEGERGEKIDSGISGKYTIAKDGNCVFYIKNNALYRWDYTDSRRVAKNVDTYRVNSDGSMVVYKISNRLYLCTVAGEEQELATDIALSGYFAKREDFFVNGDFTKVYYVTNKDQLCVVTSEGRRIEIADQISNADSIRVYDTGEIYYYRSEETQLKMADYVENDLQGLEGVAKPEYPGTEPEYPNMDDYISDEDYDDDEAYEKASKAYDKAVKKYKKECKQLLGKLGDFYTAYTQYEIAENQKKLVEAVATEIITVKEAVYYYYDGKQSVEIGRYRNADNGEYEDTAEEKAAILIRVTEDFSMDKLKLSDYGSVNDIVTDIQNAYKKWKEEHSETVLASGGQVQLLEEGDYGLNYDGSKLFCLESGNLSYQNIADGKLGKSENYDKDVDRYVFLDNEESDIVYCKEYDEATDSGELYLNKEKIDSNVYISDFEELTIKQEGKTIYYRKNVDAGDGMGTLMCCKEGKSESLARNVYSFAVLSKGDIYYLSDYGQKGGDLFRYQKKDPVRLDDNVLKIWQAVKRY